MAHRVVLRIFNGVSSGCAVSRLSAEVRFVRNRAGAGWGIFELFELLPFIEITNEQPQASATSQIRPCFFIRERATRNHGSIEAHGKPCNVGPKPFHAPARVRRGPKRRCFVRAGTAFPAHRFRVSTYPGPKESCELACKQTKARKKECEPASIEEKHPGPVFLNRREDSRKSSLKRQSGLISPETEFHADPSCRSR